MAPIPRRTVVIIQIWIFFFPMAQGLQGGKTLSAHRLTCLKSNMSRSVCTPCSLMLLCLFRDIRSIVAVWKKIETLSHEDAQALICYFNKCLNVTNRELMCEEFNKPVHASKVSALAELHSRSLKSVPLFISTRSAQILRRVIRKSASQHFFKTSLCCNFSLSLEH